MPEHARVTSYRTSFGLYVVRIGATNVYGSTNRDYARGVQDFLKMQSLTARVQIVESMERLRAHVNHDS